MHVSRWSRRIVLGAVAFSLADLPVAAQSAPTISLAPQNQDVRIPSPFEVTLSYGTPAYVSLDAPRSLTLFYSSEQASPTAFVQVDAVDASPTPPEKMSISLLDASGARVQLTGGRTESFYMAGTPDTLRLAAQWDMSAHGTGAYAYTVVVRSWWGTQYRESTAPVRVLVVNERQSPFGAGWSVAGLQRIHVQGDGSLVVTQGDGSAALFAQGTCDANGCAYTSPAGDFTTLRKLVMRDPFGNAVGEEYRRTTPEGDTLIFAGDGRLSTAKDRFGNAVTFGYTGGRLDYVQDPAGARMTLAYSASGTLTSIQDRGGRTATFQVESGNLVRVADPDSVPALRARYERHRLTTRWDRSGSGFTFGYDAAGRLATHTLPQVSTDEGPVRPVERFRSWERALLPGPDSGSFSTPAARVRAASARAELTDPRGNTTRLALDRWWSPVRVEAPLGQVSTMERDTLARVTREVSPTGHSVRYVWDGPSLIQTTDETTGRTVHVSYGIYAQVDSIWGDVTPARHYLNALGLPDSTRAGLPGSETVTHYTFDGRGRILEAVDPEGHGTFYAYRSADSVSGPLDNLYLVETGSVNSTYRRGTSYRHDRFGRVVQVKGPAGDSTRVEYDWLNRVRHTVSAGGGTTRYTYGPLFLSQLTDPKGQVYQFNRNALGWLESEVDPRSQWTNYGHDRSGNVTSVTNRRGQTVGFTFDALNRVLSRTADGKTTTYAYDNPRGLWTAAQNEESTDTLRFDVAGRPTHEVSVRGGTRYALESSYGARDLRTALRLTSPWTRSVGYGYNSFLQLDTLQDLSGGTTALEYNADRQLSYTLLPTGMYVFREYPSTHVTARIRYVAPTGVDARLGRGYSHDARALIGARRNVQGDTVRTYTYDPLERLTYYVDEYVPPDTASDCGMQVDPDTGVCLPGGTVRDYLFSESFAYDSVGNRTDGNAVVETGNRLVSFQPFGYRYTLEYDADGNLTRKLRSNPDGTLSLEQRLFWNSLGQLDSVSTAGAMVRYGYDGWGRRVRRTDSAGAVTRYVYDGDDLFAEVDGSGAPIREYTYYPGVDQPHSVRRGSDGATFYYLREYPSDVVGLVDSGNQLVNEYRYRPFGSVDHEQEGTPNPLRFQAREIDFTTELYYFRSRWYDPELTRFVSEDPIGLAGGINPYVFTANNPVNFTDPYGLMRCRWVFVEVLIDGKGGAGEWQLVCKSGGGGAGSGSDFGGRGPREERRHSKSDCKNLDAFACWEVMAGAAFLQMHQNPICRDMGTSAQQRLLQGRYYFDSRHPVARRARAWALIETGEVFLGPVAFTGLPRLPGLPFYLPGALAEEEYHIASGFRGHRKDNDFEGPASMLAPDEVAAKCRSTLWLQ